MYVRIYTANVDCLEDERLFSAAYRFAPKERREKADRLRFHRDKRLSLGAGALAEIALEEAGLSEKGIGYGENGKPFVKGGTGLFISISHSGSVAMCAVSDADAGCDVEKIGNADERIAKRFFSPEENGYISSSEDPAGAFYKIWTRKESFLKATGLGFTVPACSFSTADGIVRTELFPGVWRAFDIEICDGYAAACCVRWEAAPEVFSADVRLDEYFADRKR